ncbi:hypothetical protein Prudu_013507 [Prunus dulcis]|uniref:Uncharacterized protein n=1 Tax=Prunus dulcis TaxID=3755 RepID=A0A4Y1RG20_PRUDU|nr:hypothetical protein Prudu_013507 [Prunus dulcis]
MDRPSEIVDPKGFRTGRSSRLSLSKAAEAKLSHKRDLQEVQLDRTNSLLIPARKFADQADYGLLIPARIADQADYGLLNPARIAARIHYVSPRPARGIDGFTEELTDTRN